MAHIPEYSLVIRPPQNIIDEVAILKKRLKEVIGWFGSANAQAHITVFNFDADETELEIWKKRIQQYCDTSISQNVVFDHFDIFPPRTFFIAPDNSSAEYLNTVIKKFQGFIKVKPQAHAHLSIARSLDANKLEQAKTLFEDEAVNFEFICDSFVLRRFDFEAKQYSHIVAKFDFKGKPQPDLFTS